MLQISNKARRKQETQRRSFGNYLRSIRIEANLSIKDFAELSGFTRPTLSNYETGKTIPSVRNLYRLQDNLRELSIPQYKIDVLSQKHEDSLKASSGKVIGSVLRG